MFGLGVRGGLFIGGARRMHNILGLSRAKHFILVDSKCMGGAMRVWCYQVCGI